MSFTDWDTQKQQFEYYLRENYFLLSKKHVWSIFGVLVGLLMLLLVMIVMAMPSSVDQQRTSESTKSFDEELNAMRMQYLAAIEEAAELNQSWQDQQRVRMVEPTPVVDTQAFSNQINKVRAESRAAIAQLNRRLDIGRFDVLEAREILVKSGSPDDYIRLAVNGDSATLELTSENRAAVLRVRKDDHALLDFNRYTDAWHPVVHVGTDSNSDGSMVAGLVSLDTTGRNRLRAIYDAQSGTPLLDLVDTAGYSRLLAHLTGDQPQLNLFETRGGTPTKVTTDFGLASQIRTKPVSRTE